MNWKQMRVKQCWSIFIVVSLLMVFSGCGSKEPKASFSAVNFEDLSYEGSVELEYADQFRLEKYGDYELITVVDSGRFLLVSKGQEVPGNLPKDVTVLQKPLDHTYLVSTSAMDLVCQAGALSNISFTATKSEDWYVAQAKEAMEQGRIIYAGKYSSPDYELLLSSGCNLALENTMIYHNPEVKEKLEELGIPVLVERSSYESHPLGRMEWIKLYGHLFDLEEEANAYFLGEKQLAMEAMGKEATGKKIAFFFVNSQGMINVRKPGDYVAKMIDLSGGEYALQDILVEEENALSSMNMQMEDFYVSARDSDILVYNSTIEGELTSLDDLIRLNALFQDFKAVKEKKVYCTGKNFFQETSKTARFMEDLSKVLHDDETSLEYLYPLK